MKKVQLLWLVSLSFFLVNAQFALSQEQQQNSDAQEETVEIPKVQDGVYKKQNIPAKEPLPYPHVNESSVLWSKRIWRVIDCRQKMNHPLYFPTQDVGNRVSLFNALANGIKKGEINAYSYEAFKAPIGYDQVKKAMGAGPKQQTIPDPQNPAQEIDTVINVEMNPADIKQYLIKEDWYFDTRYSRLRVRIIGICPIRVYEEEQPDGSVRTMKEKVFWIYYPQARSVLANHEAFNRHNNARSISYDDIFQKRIFNSYVQKQANVYNNRLISDYASGMNSILESERIENKIHEWEQSLWSY